MMVASEELAPSRGWNYDELLKALTAKPAVTAYDPGRSIIDAYTIHFRSAKDQMAGFEALGTTLSMINLDQFPTLVSAVG